MLVNNPHTLHWYLLLKMCHFTCVSLIIWLFTIIFSHFMSFTLFNFTLQFFKELNKSNKFFRLYHSINGFKKTQQSRKIIGKLGIWKTQQTNPNQYRKTKFTNNPNLIQNQTKQIDCQLNRTQEFKINLALSIQINLISTIQKTNHFN